MKFIKVKTKILLPPRDNIYRIFNEHLPQLQEGDVVLITSKALGIHQGRCVKIGSVNKQSLIKQEAEMWAKGNGKVLGDFILTIKNHTIIPSSGIDESNGNGYYVLWPKKVNRLLQGIQEYLRKKYKIKKLGLIATDSHCVPLRRGTLGVAIGFYGFDPVTDYRGKPDLFGRKLKYTRSNLVDPLAAMAVLLMGEGNESVPIVIVRNAEFMKFTNKSTYRKFIFPPEKDIYEPMLSIFRK